MAISAMYKVIVVAHRDKAFDLLESLQTAGLMQIVDSQQGRSAKEWPELVSTEAAKPREIYTLIERLQKATAFLKPFEPRRPMIESALAPMAAVSRAQFDKAVTEPASMELLDRIDRLSKDLEELEKREDHAHGIIERLEPWINMDIPLDTCGRFEMAAAMPGFLPLEELDIVTEELDNIGAHVSRVGKAGSMITCVVVSLKEQNAAAGKILRSHGFEASSFEGLKGTAADIIAQTKKELDKIHLQMQKLKAIARELGTRSVSLSILLDYYKNLSARLQANGLSAQSDYTVIYEGWVRGHDMKALQAIAAKAGGAWVERIEPMEGEEIPVDIENPAVFRPFEILTRLYGMPQRSEVDPTWMLAPFYAVFFGLCLGDAGYGLILLIISVFLLRRLQGDKRLIWLFFLCSLTTIAAGVLTSSYFGDGMVYLARASEGWPDWARNIAVSAESARVRLMWFDPLAEPMKFFYLSIGLGYVQIIFGLIIGFVNNLLKREYVAAAIDQGAWLVMLNSIVILGFAKVGILPGTWGQITPWLAVAAASMIFLFSVRQGSLTERLGMGAYNVFSSIFYMGDVLSYLRLMGLGLVSAGFGMAINVIASVVMGGSKIGVIAGVIILIIGHTFSLLLSVLGAFVHSLRLQFIEFFPKFMVGGGREFTPLASEYKNVYLKE